MGTSPGDIAAPSKPARKPPGAGFWIGTTLTAVVLVALLGSGGWTQLTYPGGVTQFVSDIGAPPRLPQSVIQANVRQALVTTTAPHWHSDTVSQGSAFFFEGPTEVLTAAHVLPQPMYQVSVLDLPGATHPADVLDREDTGDFAVLRVQGMTPVPLQPSVHPLHPRSRVYLVGNPDQSTPGKVVSGEVADTDSTANHSILVTSGPIGEGMSGGPVVDEWGKVIGLIKGSSPDGHRAIVVPLSAFRAIAGSAISHGTRLYVGPPFITASYATLSVGTEIFGTRHAVQDQNKIHWKIGSSSSANYDEGDLWFFSYATPPEAVARMNKEVASEAAKWHGGGTARTKLGDGGWLLVYKDGSFTLLEEIWTERNVIAIFWIETIGRDESKFFTSVAIQQEAKLWAA